MNQEKLKKKLFVDALASQCFRVTTKPGSYCRAMDTEARLTVTLLPGNRIHPLASDLENIFQQIIFKVNIEEDALRVYLDYLLEHGQIKEKTNRKPEEIKRKLLQGALKNAWNRWHQRPPGRCPWVNLPMLKNNSL